MSDRTVWDRDLGGPSTETIWDRDHAGPGTQTLWDVLAALGAGTRILVVVMDSGRTLRVTRSGRAVELLP